MPLQDKIGVLAPVYWPVYPAATDKILINIKISRIYKPLPPVPTLRLHPVLDQTPDSRQRNAERLEIFTRTQRRFPGILYLCILVWTDRPWWKFVKSAEI